MHLSTIESHSFSFKTTSDDVPAFTFNFLGLMYIIPVLSKMTSTVLPGSNPNILVHFFGIAIAYGEVY